MSAPSLHEIAAMPFPESLNAMRRYYNPHWGKPVPDGVTRPLTWRVTLNWIVSQTDEDTIEVEAFTEEEAIEFAQDKVMSSCPGDDVEFEHCTAKQREDA